MGKTTFIATGDAFITRHLPDGGYDGFEEVKQCIEDHDIRFSNLEMTFHDQEGFPSGSSGGTWAMTDPTMLDDMLSLGFNIFNTANNHSHDYSEGGILATIRHMKERRMTFAGTGRNLGEASRPCYRETRDARVALLAASASFSMPGNQWAGGQSEDMPGRPGLNPLRTSTTYHVNQAHFDMVNVLAGVTHANKMLERRLKDKSGTPLPEGVAMFGNYKFVLDEKEWVESLPNSIDMARMESGIRDTKSQSDIVLVSIHAHDNDNGRTNEVPMFLETFAHRCIDAGADAVIGHGPHELRGIEIYKGKPIFYSLGNFIFENDTVDLQPYDAYQNRKLPLDTKIGGFIDARSKKDTVGFCKLPEIWKSVMAAWTVEDGKVTQVQLYPVDLGQKQARYRRGLPVMSRDEGTLKYLEELSEKYGTRIRIENGIGYINL